MEDIKKQKLNQTLQFYFNPIEPIRMLRYFPYQTNFNEQTLNLNTSNIYNDKINIGVVLHIDQNTKPYILDLQLNSLIKFNQLDFNILCFYQKNDLTDQIKTILNKYQIEKIEQPEKLYFKEGIGDLNILDCIYQGLFWAKNKQIDILVKLDINLIGMYNWVEGLKELAFKTDGLTFNSYGDQWKNFRTECIGFNVNWWTSTPIKYSFVWLLQNKCTVELTSWLHELSKILDGKNYSNKKLDYMINNHIDYLHSGYVIWTDLLGINESNMEERHNNTLWKSYTKEEEYKKYADQLQ